MNKKFDNPLNKVEIASPCSADWNEMKGDDRKRFCGQCNLNVFNLSGMSQKEAETLLLVSEGRLCVRFYKRADGTVITKDCPVGWAKIQLRAKRIAAAFASVVFGIIGGFGFQSVATEAKSRRSLPILQTTQTPQPLMGKPAVPTPTPTPQPLMGAVYVPEKGESTHEKQPTKVVREKKSHRRKH